MDRRQKKSRKAILGAFRKLLGQKSYAHITVKEIIDEADVGRSTFYAHFPTKDDLLFALSEEIFSHVFSHSLTKESTHDFRNSQNVSSYITHILYHVRENFPRELLKNESGEIFYRYFIIRFEDSACPIEVKSSDNTRSKSLNSLLLSGKYRIKKAIRLSTKNIGEENGIISLPIYLAFLL